LVRKLHTFFRVFPFSKTPSNAHKYRLCWLSLLLAIARNMWEVEKINFSCKPHDGLNDPELLISH